MQPPTWLGFWILHGFFSTKKGRKRSVGHGDFSGTASSTTPWGTSNGCSHLSQLGSTRQTGIRRIERLKQGRQALNDLLEMRMLYAICFRFYLHASEVYGICVPIQYQSIQIFGGMCVCCCGWVCHICPSLRMCVLWLVCWHAALDRDGQSNSSK